MKGLILKDLLILKNQMRSVLIIILGFILLSLWMENYFYIAFIIPFYIVMLVISTFSYDDLNNSNTYIVALPYSRKTIVKSRYILSVISIITSLLIGLVLSLIIPIFNSEMDFASTFASTAATILGVIFVIALLMPFIFIGIIISLFENANLNIASFFNSLENMNFIILILIAIAIMTIILYISYLASCKIFKNKEF